MNTLSTINAIVTVLADHPDVNVGNSKVHFAYHKAIAALADLMRITHMDDAINSAERSPTGDDYNDVLDVLGLHSR